MSSQTTPARTRAQKRRAETAPEVRKKNRIKTKSPKKQRRLFARISRGFESSSSEEEEEEEKEKTRSPPTSPLIRIRKQNNECKIRLGVVVISSSASDSE